MIKREYTGEGANRQVTARTFVCDACEKPVKLVGGKLTAVRLKMPDRIAEHVIVWCGACINTAGMEKCFG